MRRPAGQPGFTLLELVVVAAILVVLAGIAIPHLFGVRDSAAATATEATLASVRDAIVGDTVDHPGFRADTGRLPATVRGLFVQPTGVPTFDRITGRGWRGPYIREATGTYRIDVARGRTALYGTDGDPAVVDGWGSPIVVQSPAGGDAAQREAFTRLLSAGADGIFQTPADLYPPLDSRGDDRVLFLLRADTSP